LTLYYAGSEFVELVEISIITGRNNCIGALVYWFVKRKKKIEEEYIKHIEKRPDLLMTNLEKRKSFARERLKI
jgi:hypothetical protein